MDSSRQKAEKLWGSSRETIHDQRSIFDCFSSKISKEGVWKARKWVWLLGWRQRRACATLPSAYSPLWWGGLSCVMWPEASWKVRCSTPVDPVDPEICPVILKMENIFLLMNSIIHLWKIPCSMSIVVDISFAITCGVGLFYLLIPFLKEYPESPPPGREKNTPKVRKALTEIQWRSSPRTLISHSLEGQVWNMDFFKYRNIRICLAVISGVGYGMVSDCPQ